MSENARGNPEAGQEPLGDDTGRDANTGWDTNAVDEGAGRDPFRVFDRIAVDRSVLHTGLARHVLDRAPSDRVRIVDDAMAAQEGVGRRDDARPGAKHRLYITRETGRFLKGCPGTPGMKCCNLFVLNHIVGCPFDCRYCFLQAYQSEQLITLYANLEDLEIEVDALLARNAGREIRICTGEVADSLALEGVADVSARLIRIFASREGALLELKTKSHRVEPLLDLDHGGRTVLSFSLNTDEAARELEIGAPGPGRRIEAAARAVRAGYPVAFHFDPLVRHPGWEGAYPRRVDELFDRVPPKAVRWISLGGFRYTPAMKRHITARFPGIRLFLDEFFPGEDGKYRYFAPLRFAMYRRLVEAIRRRAENVPLYLCMESETAWRRVFGALPEEMALLEPIFGERIDPDGGIRPVDREVRRGGGRGPGCCGC